jgi:hypothetical protein
MALHWQHLLHAHCTGDRRSADKHCGKMRIQGAKKVAHEFPPSLVCSCTFSWANPVGQIPAHTPGECGFGAGAKE